MSDNSTKPKMTQEEEEEIESLAKSLVQRDKLKLLKIDKETEQQRPARLRAWFKERLKYHRDAEKNN
ncbi:hypothetical protein [Morganella psychrotolerans]|uniref:hypothetical protein n=1 Tax=Morganella psychrotolerans TaxID=368603 RepID=UPI0039AED1C0